VFLARPRDPATSSPDCLEAVVYQPRPRILRHATCSSILDNGPEDHITTQPFRKRCRVPRSPSVDSGTGLFIPPTTGKDNRIEVWPGACCRTTGTVVLSTECDSPEVGPTNDRRGGPTTRPTLDRFYDTRPVSPTTSSTHRRIAATLHHTPMEPQPHHPNLTFGNLFLLLPNAWQ